MCRIYFAWRIEYEKALRSQQIKDALAWKSLNSAWSVLTKIKLILWVDLLLWLRLGFTVIHQNPNSSQYIGQKPVVQHQRRQVRFHQQESSWHRCFGMLEAFCLLIIWKRITNNQGILFQSFNQTRRKNSWEKTRFAKEKKSSFIRTMHLPTKVFWQWEN